MPTKRTSWKDVINQRRKENFVGRADYLRQFSDNFITEIPTFLLFFVLGEGGVGKTTLLKQYEAIANHPNVAAIVIRCDDEQLSPVAAMGHIAEQLAKLDIKYKEFDERFKAYRARREEIEADTKAPRGALSLVVRGMTDFAIKATRRTPGVGVFAEYVDEKAAGEALAEGVNYLIDRISNKDEVQLLREPERILTPLFIELLNKACEKHRLVLMFDVFEHTREALEPWLLEFLDFEYGEFETNLTFVISGRDPLDQRWTQIASSICHITLEPFTQEETRLYLSHRSIIDEQLVTQIHKDTGGLPVLVELLAGTNPTPGLPLPDISKDAVKRFLQWLPEEERRHVALLAAVPRQFNLDILSASLGSDAARDFNWLSAQSYIRTSTARGWFYHEKVRELMLRYLHNTKPGDLTVAHTRLANFFETQQSQLGLDGKAAYNNKKWRELEVERIYHLLCRQTKLDISGVTNAFLKGFRWRWRFSESIIQVCEQVAHEMAAPELQRHAQVLSAFYHAYDKDEYERFTIQANVLVGLSNLSPIAEAAILGHRGNTYRQIGKYPDALADFDRALALDEKYTWALTSRGLTYLLMDKYPEALADFDRALALDEKNAAALTSRGLTYLLMDKYPEALADFDQVLTLDEKNVQALGRRGETYLWMGKYPEALADFDRALALDEKDTWTLSRRGETYLRMDKYPEALVDFDHALALDEKDTWTLTSRGETYLRMDKYPEALADFDRALALDEKNIWTLNRRGLTYLLMDKYSEALADFDRALALDEKNARALGRRGETYLRMGKYPEALADFDQVLSLDEKNAAALTSRGLTYLQMDKYPEALVDFDRALALDEKNAAALTSRGETYRQIGKYSEALADFDRALALDEKNIWTLNRRGETYRQIGKYSEALADFDRALALDEKDTWTLNRRGLTYLQRGKYPEALADFDQVLSLDEKNVQALGRRGETYLWMGKYPEALADFDQVLSLDEKNAWILDHRGETYRRMGNFGKALLDFSLAIEIDPEDDSFRLSRRAAVYQVLCDETAANADIRHVKELPFIDTPDFYNKAVVYVLSSQYAEAIELLREAIERDELARIYAQNDDLFQPIRNLTEFQELIGTYNL